ncbi:hypothetical protein MsAg5_13200 [Methanosarcinaceae archaeon Ag5]|uniref:Carboxypeptidase regulatory-like domain-containing protein n=1 Tax=Methanolapillus africanus TaxID=3028297 RepID=A0AAE4SFL4_9EURY|nr:hypothetical protein [Methanosarcinaceae archaeon Ag5]
MRNFVRIFLLATFLILLSSFAGGAPTDDGNNYYQEITVISEVTQADATFHIYMPFPFDYDKALNSYRFYDSSGNLIPSYVFGTTPEGISVTMKKDLVAGNNTIFMTGGNTSLPSVNNQSVFNFFIPISNLSNGVYNFSTPDYNFVEYNSDDNWGTYNTTVTLRFYNDSNTAMDRRLLTNNSTGVWWWNNTSASSVTLWSGPGVNEHRSVYVSTHKTDVYVQSNWTVSSNHYYAYNHSENISADDFVGNAIQFSLSRDQSKLENYTVATAMIVDTEEIYGNISFFDNATGIYIRFVDGVTGNIVSLVGPTPGNVVISTSTNAVGVNSTALYSYMRSNVTFNQSGMSTAISLVDNNSRNSVIYIQNFTYDSSFVLTTPSGVNVNYNQTTYSETIPAESRIRVMDMAFVREISPNNTSIWGVVVDQFGRPIPGVDVSMVNGVTTYTLQSQDGGEFGKSAVTGQWYITFQKDGYETLTGYLTGPTKQVVELNKLYNITIHVVDENGSPVRSFTTFFGSNQSIKSTDDGTVVYKNVPGGEQEVIIQASGYAQVTKSIFISDNSTDFTLTVTKESAQEYTTPHYVRLFYRTLLGSPISNLTVDVYEGDGGDSVFSGITGVDGSVSFRLEETIKYRFVARTDLQIVHEFSTYPKSDEYVIFLGNVNQSDPSVVLDNLLYSITSADVNTTHARIFVNMTTNGSNDTVDFVINVYKGDVLYTNASGNFTGTQNESFLVTKDGTYIVSVTFTDQDGKSKTVSKTIRFDSAEIKAKFKLPRFTEQWHYDALCVFIVLVTAFLFSERTKHLGMFIIPVEFFGLLMVGWMRFSSFAIGLCIAVVFAGIVIVTERVERE